MPLGKPLDFPGGAKCNDKCPFKRQKIEEDEIAEMWLQARNTWSCLKLEEARKESPPEPSRAVQPCKDTLISEV